VQQLLEDEPALLQQLPAVSAQLDAEKKRFGKLEAYRRRFGTLPARQNAAAAAAAAAGGEDQENMNADGDRHDTDVEAAAVAAEGDATFVEGEDMLMTTDAAGAADEAALAAAIDGDGGFMLDAAIDDAAIDFGDEGTGADEEAAVRGCQEAAGAAAAAAQAAPAAAAVAAAQAAGVGGVAPVQAAAEEAAAALTVKELRELLAARQKSRSLGDTQNAVLNMWQAAAGGSNDVAVLLQQDTFSRLLQSFKQPGEGGKCRKASTRVEYIRRVLHVLALEQVEQLLSQQQLQQLKQQAAAEKQQATKAAAAAPGRVFAAAAAGCGVAGAGKSKTVGGGGGGPIRPACQKVSASAPWCTYCMMLCSHVPSCTSRALQELCTNTKESLCAVMMPQCFKHCKGIVPTARRPFGLS
jgi:hypothetical protein